MGPSFRGSPRRRRPRAAHHRLVPEPPGAVLEASPPRILFATRATAKERRAAWVSGSLGSIPELSANISLGLRPRLRVFWAAGDPVVSRSQQCQRHQGIAFLGLGESPSKLRAESVATATSRSKERSRSLGARAVFPPLRRLFGLRPGHPRELRARWPGSGPDGGTGRLDQLTSWPVVTCVIRTDSQALPEPPGSLLHRRLGR